VTNSARATRNPRPGFLRPDCGDSLLSCLDDKCPRIASALRLVARVYRKGSAAAAAAAAAVRPGSTRGEHDSPDRWARYQDRTINRVVSAPLNSANDTAIRVNYVLMTSESITLVDNAARQRPARLRCNSLLRQRRGNDSSDTRWTEPFHPSTGERLYRMDLINESFCAPPFRVKSRFMAGSIKSRSLYKAISVISFS